MMKSFFAFQLSKKTKLQVWTGLDDPLDKLDGFRFIPACHWHSATCLRKTIWTKLPKVGRRQKFQNCQSRFLVERKQRSCMTSTFVLYIYISLSLSLFLLEFPCSLSLFAEFLSSPLLHLSFLCWFSFFVAILLYDVMFAWDCLCPVWSWQQNSRSSQLIAIRAAARNSVQLGGFCPILCET